MVTHVTYIQQEPESKPDCVTCDVSKTGIGLQGEEDRLHARNN
jgi:hypothetical protein